MGRDFDFKALFFGKECVLRFGVLRTCGLNPNDVVRVFL